MNRRAFLGTLPTLALAGCATRLGLADRVEVTAKYVHAVEQGDGSEVENGTGEGDETEDENEDEDGHLVELVTRRSDPTSGPTYGDEIHDLLADDIDPDDPLTISEATSERLEGSFETVRYGMRGCESVDASSGDESGCRDTWLFLDDFNDVEVGDVVDVRYGDETSGIVTVHD